jgi:hypothetical protein
MEQIPRELDRFSANQEIPHFLWILKVHYHVRKSLPLGTIMSQMNPSISWNCFLKQILILSSH